MRLFKLTNIENKDTVSGDEYAKLKAVNADLLLALGLIKARRRDDVGCRPAVKCESCRQMLTCIAGVAHRAIAKAKGEI